MELKHVSEKLKDLDFCMLVTESSKSGELAGRPMSNNRQVDYQGDSYFFSLESTTAVSDIQANPKVGLTFAEGKSLLGKPGAFIHVAGKGEIIKDKSLFKAHWTKDLDYWFEQGVETPGLVMIKVHASRIHLWNGKEEAEIKL
ncbi:pyridoxamine 5'-phosphate oxidase [Bdellovibrio bacteriovorus]|uniref:Pyridoxamine 5'-phosphate oxidase n=1 Tax=Bdellovibrio bacteriovorus TaxID=959 RepID=A0A150WN10_BDEBC|nr:pyridoxamine 5'-phosphate oxidase family protein [Bdellovibrio bacteriovorus]KYG65697.1 pyridoxamine 5'-phosphate oxidase [Bdellovibrio bacteriovorus]